MAYGFGIVGAGVISAFHARALAMVDGARLVGVTDAVPQAAAAFAAEVAAVVTGAVEVARVQTNIVVLDTGKVTAASVVAAASAAGVKLSAVGARAVRAVTHQEVSVDEAIAAGRIVAEVLAG